MKYFAYGSNMDQIQMSERCPDAKLRGKAFLRDYKIGFTIFSPKRNCGCADIIPCKGDTVWGLLYEISPNDLRRLDEAESHPDKYKRFQVEVFGDDGKKYLAETYEVAKKEGIFIKPSAHYIGLMISAAKKFDFPQEYQSLLAKIQA